MQALADNYDKAVVEVWLRNCLLTVLSTCLLAQLASRYERGHTSKVQVLGHASQMQVSIQISMQSNCAGKQCRQLEKGTLWFQSIATCIHTSIGVILSVHRLLVVST